MYRILVPLSLSVFSVAIAGEPPAALPCAEPPPGMACVPGGPFVRGTDDGDKNARPAETVWLQTFYMDQLEVTVAQYDACVKAGKCKPAKTNYSDFSRPRQPKVGLSWYHARDYCAAQGKHMPTEAEWEKAARGSDGRPYPWGDEPATCARAVIKDSRGRSCGVKKASGGRPETGRTFEVGSRPPNPYGLYDMAGNAWEWVADWYAPSYARCGAACRGVDPRGPCDGRAKCPGHDMKIVRGGSWYWGAERATCYHRRPHYPANRPYHHYGFRCAASLEQAARLRPGSAAESGAGHR
ncbi:MAG: SUMF1/EgtB/PvdO family nonheme iron enzyme [Deltaproteobacteria bacterium]|nr:SUMF1/EgtB/PvdO family nonheme iron enzyme [Deltaproteobacteria bacterium]